MAIASFPANCLCKYFYTVKATQYGGSFQISFRMAPLCYSTQESTHTLSHFLKNCMHVYNVILVMFLTHSLPPAHSALPVSHIYCWDKTP